ncbi:MAG TPA: winged helix DNA-binding domain-containing protein [Solirubrobacterales bacterium]|nr:winged helix DNA-binding domain-containing protein [Solirubrobacterales bacterium]
MAAGRTLTQGELNRALLARQLLLERSAAAIPKVLDRMGGLQAQYAPSMYIGLWSRLEGFERAQLDRALERRGVVQATLMRATIHLVSRSDYWPMGIGIRRSRREAWVDGRARLGYSAKQVSTAARKLRGRLGDGTMSRKEIHELLGSDSVITNGVNMWLDLVRVPPSGTWERRRADLYAAAEHWLGPPPAKLGEEDGIELLVKRYLGGFGPSTLEEITNWAGLPPKRVAPVLERIGLRRFEAEDGAELLDLPRLPLPDPETPAPVRFLPTWDASLLVHARRTGILPEQHRPKVFNSRTPQSVATFLVDGRVAGTWRYERGRVRTKPFGKLDAAAKRDLREEGERLAELHA